MSVAEKARRAAFLLLAVACLWPPVSAPVALGAGIAFALALGNPFAGPVARFSGLLLKSCVVGLGFGLPLDAVVSAGLTGLWVTGLGVLAILACGLLLARVFALDRECGHLLSAGTAICGGSAIAAVAPVIGARSETISMSLACVFVLNAVALYAFPWVGGLLGLSQSQFAVWAAIAIHDTSSVVGAAATYGEQALAEATVLKLARAMWIVPLVVGFLGSSHAVRKGVRGGLPGHCLSRCLCWPPGCAQYYRGWKNLRHAFSRCAPRPGAGPVFDWQRAGHADAALAGLAAAGARGAAVAAGFIGGACAGDVESGSNGLNNRSPSVQWTIDARL